VINRMWHRASRLLQPAWKARVAEDSQDGAAALESDRREATESILSGLRGTVPSTLAVVLLSLLAAALLGVYYAHAYKNAHGLPRGTATHAADADDKPLPPLTGVENAPVVKASSHSRSYLIGNILETNDDLDRRTDMEVPLDGTGTGVGTGRESEILSPPRPRARHLDGDVFVRARQPGSAAPSSPADSEPGNAGRGVRDAGAESPVAQLLRADVAPAVAAAVLPTQRLLLPKGAFLDCSLETAIDSSLPGLTTCVTALDTFSADGTVVLLERGTKLIGEMRSQMQQGMARVFVLWTEARTPKGVVVALASPGTDELGRSGLPGTVDRHFAERFGAAILVSVINGAIQSAVNRSQQPGGTVILNPTGIGDVATEILRSTLSIPPTVRVPPGERIQVLVARDLDFRSVYALHVR
jgi:type IV secretion system protein VirB10